MSPSRWHRLRLSQKGLPSLLLFQYSWTQKGYEICVTDLTTIWSEKLSHGQVVKRAEEDATTIDAGESPDQFDVLLSKIGEALQGEGGSATLCRGSSADALELHTNTKLPAPLKPLRWSLYLAKDPPSSLTDRILFPLLKDEARWEGDQRSLLDQIKQKDWVLGKLFDKLETIGVELGTVFPSAAGFRTSRKGSSRSEAARFVKGIAPFDEQAWLAESEKASAGTSGLAANIIHETATSDGSLDLGQLHALRDQWWRDLERCQVATIGQEDEDEVAAEDLHTLQGQTTAAPELDLDKGGDATEESEDDEFQRQETPPRLKARKAQPATSPKPQAKKKVSPQPPGDETDQSAEVESEPEPTPAHPPPSKRAPSIPPKPKQPSPPPQTLPQAPPKKPKAGLGVIGGKKKKEQQPQHALTPLSPPQAPKPTTEPEPPSHPPPQTKRPTKLGMIGGKSKSKSKAAEDIEKVSTQSKPEAEPGTPSPKQGRPLTLDEVSAAPESSPKKPERPSEPPVPRKAPETEKEKADRRREELKRELEAKGDAPTKKKRRF